MFRLLFLLNLCCFFLVGACSSTFGIKVSSDYKDHVNYAALKHYGWFQDDGNTAKRAVDPLIEQRITDNINAEFAAKQYTLSTKPDFLVNFTVAAADIVDIKSYYTYSGYSPGFSWNRDSYGFSQLEKQSSLDVVRQGSLVIDILDAKNKTILWRGVAKKRLADKPYAKEKRDALIKSAVQQVLANFPPK